ncbi:hypothetical protein GCM10023216_05870 [Isoptericola chiayiensis]|uniref:Lipid A biosynthesis acyltransferase n=2 Tax=Isoptericola chiayiensis TaxID=579446 RepID=A0ABP8Y3J4_9MICO
MGSQRKDFARYVLYRSVFAPAGRHLPMSVARALAWGFAGLLVALDARRGTGWRPFRAVLGCSAPRAVAAFWAQQAALLEEHAFQSAVLARRLTPDAYEFCIAATPEARQVLDGQGPLVVVSGHFIRDPAIYAAFAAQVGGRNSALITATPPESASTPQEQRIQRQLGLSLEALAPWSEPLDFQLIYLGNAATQAVRALRDEKRMLWVNIDAPWQAGRGRTVSVPFAGHATRHFSTGSARIARSVGCPLLLILPGVVRKTEVVVHVLGPYSSSATDPSERDADVTRQVLRAIEDHIGTNPRRYSLDLGQERRWNKSARHWDVI